MNYKKMVSETAEYFNKGEHKVGDALHEMLSYWIYIIKVNGEIIYTLEGHPRNDNLKLQKYSSKEEFKKKCTYKTSDDNYWVCFHKNEPALYDDFVDTYFKQVGDVSSDRDTIIERLLLDV